MKKASAKIRRKVKVKFYRELNSMEEKFEFKKAGSSLKDASKQAKRK